MPCFNTPAKYFEPLLASVFAQSYQNWELVLADASNQQKKTDYLRAKARADTRITYFKIPNQGIAINTNAAIEKANGHYIAFLDHDDTLDPDALATSMQFFVDNPEYGLVYSDEDKVSDDGEYYFEPHFKPDFSLDMLRNVNYITHFVVAKKALVDGLKGVRSGFDGAQDYDFLLRVVDTGTKIGHIAKILYHWRQADGSTAADFSNKQDVTDAGCRALDEHYLRRKIEGVKNTAIAHRPGFYRPVCSQKLSGLIIFVDLANLHLSSIERNFIIERYKSNHDVMAHKIVVTEGLPASGAKTDKALVVRGAFIPANDTSDLFSLFVLASEGGVAGVAPKLVRNGRIYDMGLVTIAGRSEYLFRGLNPNKSIGFGSLEWVRNVNALSGAVGIETGRPGRYAVWSHTEFVAFDKINAVVSSDQAYFYNPNVTELSELVEQSSDYIADLLEIK
ncbi:MAG: glycosyltransferase [Cytophaga sp.]|nr:glycosyltransferase [Undibacterium sp.]